MSFFRTQNGTKEASTMPKERSSRTGTQGEGAVSIIGPGMTVSGDVVTEGTVRVEGRVEGSIRAGKSVLVGRSGEIVGDISTQEAVIAGRLQGTLVAEGRLELQGTAVIEGEIHARAHHLQLEEGARFNGRIQMLDEGVEERLAIPASTSLVSAVEDSPQVAVMT
jgi:cytoskeletal protein CcmA (bactofilin family)